MPPRLAIVRCEVVRCDPKHRRAAWRRYRSAGGMDEEDATPFEKPELAMQIVRQRAGVLSQGDGNN